MMQNSDQNPWDSPLDESRIEQIVPSLPSGQAVARFRRLSRPRPDLNQWNGFVSTVALAVATLFASAAIVFFFAANWQELDRFAKLGILMTGFLGCAIGFRFGGPDQTLGRCAQVLAFFLLGTFLAVFGQTYQTGADDWRLFGLWALLMVPWTALSRWWLPWWLHGALIVLTGTLWVDQTFPAAEASRLAWVCAGLAGLIWAAWEYGARSGASWLGVRIGPWTFAAMTFIALCIPGLNNLQWLDTEPATLAARLTLVGLLTFSLTLYRRHISREIPVPAMALSACIMVLTFMLGDLIIDDLDLEGTGLLIVGAILIFEVSGATWLLQRLHRESREVGS